jgi:V/A-type H+-transporting ATPase subunit A
MDEIRGKIYGVSGPVVMASSMKGAKMYTTCHVGYAGLLGEIIRIEGDMATIQVYEDTTGLTLGEEVISFGRPLTAMLGPGLLSNVYDGIQRPLYIVSERGAYIGKGIRIEGLDLDRKWDFNPHKKAGDEVTPGDILGSFAETESITHKVMVPPGVKGVIKEISKGSVSGRSPVCVLTDGKTVRLFQEWPVRVPRPFKSKLSPTDPFVTGQRVFDTLLPIAEGGTAAVPGGFGTGKTVVEHTIAKYARTDIVIYIGCGERGNEMTEVLTEFPHLKDPMTGLPLNMRTVIIANTSNMPVAAREASIFTGITIAEYFRDMGYRVALMADSISRWAEALREISSRLEEMPSEEGFPPYLASRLGGFYERAGKVNCLGNDGRTGSVTVISAISPPGGDFSEPVTQASLRVAGALWALDTELAYARHFPAVNWKRSFSLYYKKLSSWFEREVAPDMVELRSRLAALLQKEEELNEVVQVIGVEALQDTDRLTLEAATIAREGFLRQSAFSETDAFASFEKQYWMLKAIFGFLDSSMKALERGVYLERIIESPLRTSLLRMQNLSSEGFREWAEDMIGKIEKELLSVE